MKEKETKDQFEERLISTFTFKVKYIVFWVIMANAFFAILCIHFTVSYARMILHLLYSK